ncbi:VOC family protein [Nocardioides houyundeii]|uniref:VOC family protein n=1 Tax=Nocardioides houyundeii TaxID=2045452 RepID=UPI000C77C9EF|nr:VOC family protein [Nocardioides houyundeii]
MTPFWLTAFLDLPTPYFGRTVRFWADVTGYEVSPVRGADGEFASLLPPVGDEHLRVQRVGDGEPRIHLDLHVADPAAAARSAEQAGATRVAEAGHVVMRSPGGLDFCLVSHPASLRASPAEWSEGTSMVDQVTLDIPALDYDAECDFWAAVLGAPWRPSPTHAEFRRIVLPGLPLGVLLQRLAEAEGGVRAHLDLAAGDRHAEVRRHLALGARVSAEHLQWSVMTDPAGSPYCITGRTPGTANPTTDGRPQKDAS